jgi:hypothetical protein
MTHPTTRHARATPMPGSAPPGVSVASRTVKPPANHATPTRKDTR